MGSTHFGPDLALPFSSLPEKNEDTRRSILARSCTGVRPDVPTAIQSQVDGLVGRFVDEASDWRMLASFMAGSFAYRWGRISVLNGVAIRESPLLARPLSFIFGLTAEVGAFELTNRTFQTFLTNAPLTLQDQSPITNHRSPNLWSWSGPGGWKQALINDFLTFGLLKGAGYLSRESNLVFQHAFSSTAMVAGHQGAALLGIAPRPEGSLAEQFLHAEVMNLQMMAGMELVHGMVPTLPALERGLGSWLKIFPNVGAGIPPPSTGGRLRIQLSLIEPKLRAGGSPPLPFQYYSVSTKEGGSLPQNKIHDLTARYRPLFPPESPTTFSDAIVARALATPSEIPHFHERLLEAYAQVPLPIRGSRDQLFTVHAIQRIFQYDPLRTGTGSFENTLLQFFLIESLKDPRSSHRQTALQELFQAMDAGMSRSALYRLFGRFGYNRNLGSSMEPDYSQAWVERHSLEIQHHLGSYRDEDRDQWVDFISRYYEGEDAKISKVLAILGNSYVSGRYRTEDIHTALDFAKSHPMGPLVLHRILQIFAIEDHPAKLKELRPEKAVDTGQIISNWLAMGVDPETIARGLNGTRHTAYVEDLRLARKVVSVYRDVAPSIMNPELRNENRRLLKEAILEFLHSGERFDPAQILRLLRTHPDPRTHPLRGIEGLLEIKILSAKKFDEAVREEWGEDSLCEYAFLGRTNDPNSPYAIYLREMPPIDASSIEGLNRGMIEIVFRLMATVHEWEHWRHFTGNFEGIESPSEAIVISEMSRHERLVSEPMAGLEERRWTLLNFDLDFYEVARRLGENLPIFYRNLNDHGYYHATNRRLTREISEGFLGKVFFDLKGSLF